MISSQKKKIHENFLRNKIYTNIKKKEKKKMRQLFYL